MRNLLQHRFASLWRRLRATTDPTPVVDDLLARWSEPHRHYHTLAHLEACLTAFDAHLSLAGHPAATEAALWFHDAVYDPRSADNETRSGALAASALRTGQVNPTIITKVARLVLATRDHEADSDPDTALLLDIDLAVLGASPAVHQSYADAIRREYAWVPEAEYRIKRAAILSRFLQRPRLFLTEPFFATHEARARTNLTREIQTLSAPPR